MTSVQVKDIKGKSVGEVNLSQDVFGVEPNVHVMHLSLKRQLSNARRGTACTKTRSEVAGGGRKPYRQKGTGQARAGSIRSPLWNGGGVVFGPKPRSHAKDMPKKARQLALASALSAKKDAFVVVNNFDSLLKDGIKTKSVCAALGDLGIADKKILLVLDDKTNKHKEMGLAARNIDRLTVVHSSNLNVKDLVDADHILIAEPTLKAVDTWMQESKNSGAADKAPKAKAEKPAKKAAGEKAAKASTKAAPAKQVKKATKKEAK